MSNFAIFIPTDVTRREDGQPTLCVKHKREFIQHCINDGKYEELQKMTWAERDAEYIKWEQKHYPPKKQSQ